MKIVSSPETVPATSPAALSMATATLRAAPIVVFTTVMDGPAVRTSRTNDATEEGQRRPSLAGRGLQPAKCGRRVALHLTLEPGDAPVTKRVAEPEAHPGGEGEADEADHAVGHGVDSCGYREEQVAHPWLRAMSSAGLLLISGGKKIAPIWLHTTSTPKAVPKYASRRRDDDGSVGSTDASCTICRQ